MAALELRLFGRPRARVDGVELRFDTRKASAILALLAVSGREHARDALAATLWPELDRVHARGALRRTLSVTSKVGPALEVSAGGVRLDPGLLRCDVREFRRLIEEPDASSWRSAAELAADGFLEGFALRDSPAFEDWQIATADSLRDLASRNLGRLVDDAVARGDLSSAVSFARRRVQLEPLSEPAQAELIRVTAWSGDRPAALTAYRALVRLLDRELGVPPLPETLALHEAIRGGTLAPPASARIRPAGPDRPAASGLPGDEAPGIRVLHGRDHLLGLLDAAWTAARDHGSAVGLVGEPGIGKTAIIAEFAARRAESGVRVLRLAGHEAERGLAYAAGNDLVRAMFASLPGLPAALGAAGEPLGVLTNRLDDGGSNEITGPGDVQRVHEALRAALAVFAKDGALLAIDDAHLLDQPSAALLAYTLRRPPPGLLIVAAWTAGEGGAPVPASVIEAASALAIPPLDAEAIAGMLRCSADAAAEVLRRTRGIPLLVGEYALPTAAEHAPVGVRELVAARFEAASPTTRQLVAAAAVIGTVSDPELLRIASGRAESETVDAIEEAISRGLLVERSDVSGYDVPHDLVRDVALGWLSLARARLLHGRVADVLARRHGVDPGATPAGAVARHAAQAGRDDEATDWYLAAADEAARLFAHAEALELLDAARALGRSPLDVHERTGGVLVRLGRYGDALVSFDRACALAEGDRGRQAEIEHAIAGVYDRLGEAALAEAHLEASYELLVDTGTEAGIPDGTALGGSGHDPRAARVLADLALVRHRRGREEDALATASAATAAAGASDEAALAQARNVLGMLALARGAMPEAEDHVRAALAHARSAGDLDLRIAALNNLSHVLEAKGDAQAALQTAYETVELAQRQGDRHRLASLHSHLADLLHAVGRDEDAVAQLKRSAAEFADVQDAQTRPAVWTLTEW